MLHLLQSKGLSRELNLMRALDEDTRVFSFYFSSSPLARLGIPPFISDPGNLCLLIDLLRVCLLYTSDAADE